MTASASGQNAASQKALKTNGADSRIEEIPPHPGGPPVEQRSPREVVGAIGEGDRGEGDGIVGGVPLSRVGFQHRERRRLVPTNERITNDAVQRHDAWGVPEVAAGAEDDAEVAEIADVRVWTIEIR